jgi:hypothetical protein
VTGKIVDLDVLTNLNVFGHPEWSCGYMYVRKKVCMYVCMCLSLALNARKDFNHISSFKCLYIRALLRFHEFASTWFVSFRFSYQRIICISLPFSACYMLGPSHPI